MRKRREHKDGWIGRCMYGWADGCMDGGMDGVCEGKRTGTVLLWFYGRTPAARK